MTFELNREDIAGALSTHSFVDWSWCTHSHTTATSDLLVIRQPIISRSASLARINSPGTQRAPVKSGALDNTVTCRLSKCAHDTGLANRWMWL